MKETQFTMVDESGKEVVYDVLFTFDSDETKKSYIVYTDNTTDKDGNIEVYASTYAVENGNTRLDKIETEKEWKIIQTILETLEEEIKNKKNNQNNEQ